ncbi:MAG: hypothetical protein ACRDQE_05855 [Gaiellales bacterium]
MARKILVGAGVAALSFLAIAPSASAKWILGNGQTDLEITAPDPGQPFRVCADRVQGRAGLSTANDPAVTPPPPGPYAPILVRVFAGAPGTLDGAEVQGDGTLLLLDGTTATPAATQLTSAPTAVDPPESYFGDFSETFLVWEYAAAPFDISIPSDRSQPGDEVLVQQGSHSAYVTLGTIACSSGPITARIDVLPGKSKNHVAPSVKRPVLIVRLFGSATLDVTGVTDVRLGNAAAAPIPSDQTKRFAPKDRNHDGYLDRDFRFVPAATGITCSSTSVSLTGRTAGGTSFSGSDAVKPVHC